MTTLMKRRKRNRVIPMDNTLITPWNNSFLRPWAGRLFNSNFDNMSLGKFDDFFQNDFLENDSLMPAMNVQEHTDNFEIELAVPGYNKKDIEVSIEDDVLHVSGNKEIEEEKKEEDYSRKEFSYKSFKRSIVLPPSVNLDQDIKASYKSGILKIILFKKVDDKAQIPNKKVIEVE